jgi:YVTN family beta-propeller protein
MSAPSAQAQEAQGGTLDCRGKPASETGRAILERFNSLRPGARLDVALDAYSSGLRMGLLEAGMRHTATKQDDGGWRLAISRGSAPAQGSIPGVHHVVSDGSSVWTCERGARVARIDAASRCLAAVDRIARKASHLALDAHAGRLFLADAEANEVIALRAADLAVQARWRAPGGPQLPLVSPDGSVCVTGGTTGTLTIARPRHDGYHEQTIAIGACPHDPLLAADGEHVFVPCADPGNGELVKARLADGRIVGRCPAGDGPSHLAAHPNGTRIYCANSWDGTVSCVSAEGEHIATTASAASGGWAHAIDITPDGRWLFVANFLDDSVAVFDAETLERVALLPTEAYPHGLDVSPDGRHLVATGFAADHVRVYDARSHRELARIAVGAGSSHTAFCGAAAYVGCSVSDHIARIDLANLSLTGQISIH